MLPLTALTTRLAPRIPQTHFHTAPALPRPMGGTIGPERIEKNRVNTQQPAKTEKTEEVAKEKLPTDAKRVDANRDQLNLAEANAIYYGSTRGSKYTGA